MRHLSLVALASTLVLLTSCSREPAVAAPPAKPARNVSAMTLKPELFKVEIRLPCLSRPREVIELRAARQGRIAWLPFKEGDVVPGSASPNAVEKLEQLTPVARIEDSDLQVLLSAQTTRLESARRALKRVMDYADSTREQLDQAQTAFDLAQSDLRSTEQHIRDSYIVSPLPGVLTQRLRQVGEYVNMGELIGVVSVLDPLVVSYEVPEAHVARVKAGDEISVDFPAMSITSRRAVVRLVDKTAHPQTHTFRVEAEMPNAGLSLPAGVFGTLMLTIYDNPAALVVPLDAIKLEGAKQYVMVLREGRAQKREVEVGRFTGNQVEVLSGLKAGERIATLGARLLNDGDSVIVRDDPTKPASAK